MSEWGRPSSGASDWNKDYYSSDEFYEELATFELEHSQSGGLVLRKEHDELEAAFVRTVAGVMRGHRPDPELTDPRDDEDGPGCSYCTNEEDTWYWVGWPCGFLTHLESITPPEIYRAALASLGEPGA